MKIAVITKNAIAIYQTTVINDTTQADISLKKKPLAKPLKTIMPS